MKTKTRVRHTKNMFWGMIGLLTVFVLIFMIYTPKAEAQDPQREDFLQFCVDRWGVTETDECFKAQSHAVGLLRKFVMLDIEKVNTTAKLCIDKHTYPEYKGVVDVVSVIGCMTEVLEGEGKTIRYPLPRI